MNRSLSTILKDFVSYQTTNWVSIGYPTRDSVLLGAKSEPCKPINLSVDEVDLIEKTLITMKENHSGWYEIFRHYYFDKFSVEKCAVRMGVSTATAHRHLSQTKGYIFGKLEDKIQGIIP